MKDYKFILIDGSSYLYRAFHALPPLTNSHGEPTGAVYGVINMIRKLIADYDPEYIAVVFDAEGKSFRHAIYPPYKANRPIMPPDLQVQVPPLRELIKAMGLPLLVIESVEADDVIATLAVKAEQEGMQTLISTGDKDMTQLASDKVHLINTMSNVLLDDKGVQDKFGVTPERIIDYLALVGDSSDNIPGVPKVGPKTAVKWLQEYGSLEEIIKHADEIKGKVGENLRATLAQLPISKKLVTLKLNVALDFAPRDLKKQAEDDKKLIPLLKKLEFKKWLAELLTTEHSDPVQDVDLYLEKLQKAGSCAFHLDVKNNEISGISFAIKINAVIYLPISRDIWRKIKTILENNNIAKIGYDIKSSLKILAKHNINLQGIKFDTMLEAYVLNSTASRYDKTLIANADMILQAHAEFWPRITKEPGLLKVFQQIEMPLIKVLANLEQNGVAIDAEFLNNESKKFGNRITELEEQAYKLAGGVFNLASPKQLSEILFTKLKLPILKKTPIGQPSTAEAVLQTLALDYPLPKIVLEHRSLSKLKSTYTDSLPRQINPATGRVHTSYNQAVTATGRLSSTNPNLQNIPIRTTEGREIRKAFIAPPGYKIVSADYSQIELRIMAHLSQDKDLLAAFSNGEDIHKATAAEVFAIALENVTKEQRRSAKAINFGLIYGMSAFGLARQLDISHEAAQNYIDLYFARYPRVKDFMEETRNKARKNGFVETLFGRRLYVPDINASNLQRQSAAERAAINAPMQGTAADIIKLAMINIDNWTQHTKLDIKMIMQVHDELVFEIAEKDVKSAIENIQKYMIESHLSVPIAVHIGIGNNWDEAH
jgi:DNA polymerase-1